MNQNFFEAAMKHLEQLSPEQIKQALIDAGILQAEDITAEVENDLAPRRPELRFYAFANFYLSSIQQGIQTGHAAVDIVRKYTKTEYDPLDPACPRQMVEDWADNFKTFITLNGGNHTGIQKALELASNSGYPFVAFHEDEDSLAGLMTSVGVVLPDYIFNLRKKQYDTGEVRYEWKEPVSGVTYVVDEIANPDLFNFVDFLKSKDLAK